MGPDDYLSGSESWGDVVLRRTVAFGQTIPLTDEDFSMTTESEMFSRWRKDSVRVLQMIPLFSTLSRRHLKRMSPHFLEKRVEAGTELVSQGQRAGDFILILGGTARVERDGHLLGHLEAGAFCGEMALIDGEPRSATVVTESPANVVAFGHGAFQELMDSTPGMRKKIMEAMCRRLREVDAALAAVN